MFTVLATLAPRAAAQGVDEALRGLAWLAGCWAAERGDAGSGEQWMPLAGGTLFGLSRTVRNGRTAAHEFMQIREVEPGRIGLIALPSGQPEATFKLASQSDRETVFENPTHDFPQRVIYRREDGERMLGRIEGLRQGVARGIDFPMRRVPCPAGATAR